MHAVAAADDSVRLREVRRRKSAINHGDPTAVDYAPRTVFTVDLRSKALVLV